MKKEVNIHWIGLFLLSMCVYLGGFAQQTVQVQGSIQDAETGAALPFASVRIEGTTVGTAANLDGVFSLEVPVEYAAGTLVFSYLGYVPQTFAIAKGGTQALEIKLAPAAVELEAVEIRPITAETYIREAMEKRHRNYGTHFQANAYFRQVSMDRDIPLQFAEGYFQTYLPTFVDTVPMQQRLLLYQEKEDVGEMAFGQRKQEKKLNKARKKADKAGEEFDEAKAKEEASIVQMGMLPPSELIENDPVRILEAFLNPEYFNKYRYEFGKNTRYQGREMVVIHFESKGKVEQVGSSIKSKQAGTLYFDELTQALASAHYNSEMKIPALLRPILFMAGYGIGNPRFHKQVNYQFHDGRWYPLSTRFDLGMKLTRRYTFAKNETSELNANILLAFSQFDTQGASPIAEAVRFDTDKEMKDQVKPIAGIGWDQVNRIAFEN